MADISEKILLKGLKKGWVEKQYPEFWTSHRVLFIPFSDWRLMQYLHLFITLHIKALESKSASLTKFVHVLLCSQLRKLKYKYLKRQNKNILYVCVFYKRGRRGWISAIMHGINLGILHL